MKTDKEIKNKIFEVIEKVNEMEDLEESIYWIGVVKGLMFCLGFQIDLNNKEEKIN